ncbi:hypothetical protein AGLY_009269 [Aphis glycines]|uniref:Uncharacterized protein n=1 Tax=Aphis glycines TaxID=307491 RepID=A0A6G0TIU0_APHGL|nr:hypothetical protein AGLY_009269 [Aphis glycines]
MEKRLLHLSDLCETPTVHILHRYVGNVPMLIADNCNIYHLVYLLSYEGRGPVKMCSRAVVWRSLQYSIVISIEIGILCILTTVSKLQLNIMCDKAIKVIVCTLENKNSQYLIFIIGKNKQKNKGKRKFLRKFKYSITYVINLCVSDPIDTECTNIPSHIFVCLVKYLCAIRAKDFILDFIRLNNQQAIYMTTLRIFTLISTYYIKKKRLPLQLHFKKLTLFELHQYVSNSHNPNFLIYLYPLYSLSSVVYNKQKTKYYENIVPSPCIKLFERYIISAQEKWLLIKLNWNSVQMNVEISQIMKLCNICYLKFQS